MIFLNAGKLSSLNLVEEFLRKTTTAVVSEYKSRSRLSFRGAKAGTLKFRSPSMPHIKNGPLKLPNAVGTRHPKRKITCSLAILLGENF
jgi:hypothetical protein